MKRGLEGRPKKSLWASPRGIMDVCRDFSDVELVKCSGGRGERRFGVSYFWQSLEKFFYNENIEYRQITKLKG